MTMIHHGISNCMTAESSMVSFFIFVQVALNILSLVLLAKNAVVVTVADLTTNAILKSSIMFQSSPTTLYKCLNLQEAS